MPTQLDPKRKSITKVYGASWIPKVEAMSDSQVHAIYMRLLNAGKIK